MSEPRPSDDRCIRSEFAAELTAGDGRTVDCRIVPYGERIKHNDGLGGVPKAMPYTEEWAPGAFDAPAEGREPGRSRTSSTSRGSAGIVGHGVALRSRAPTACTGRSRSTRTADGDKALMLIREGVLDGVSLEAVPEEDGPHGGRCGPARQGAPAGGRVLPLRRLPGRGRARRPRGGQRRRLDEELLPVEMDPELVERCRRLGIDLPQRYQAHPDETDTPPSGHLRDGTRQTVPATTSEETMSATQSELRLARLIDERETTHKLHEEHARRRREARRRTR